jgi:hypothetical protein
MIKTVHITFAAVATLAAATQPACPGLEVRPTPPPCESGFVALLMPNPFPGAAARGCPILATSVEVGSGKIYSRRAIPATDLPSFLPSNSAEPKAGCLNKPCPRLTVSFESAASFTLSTDSGAAADPCSGNPMMEWPGSSNSVAFGGFLNDALMIKAAQDADRARVASLSAQGQ